MPIILKHFLLVYGDMAINRKFILSRPHLESQLHVPKDYFKGTGVTSGGVGAG